jgi:hypothetical protein
VWFCLAPVVEKSSSFSIKHEKPRSTTVRYSATGFPAPGDGNLWNSSSTSGNSSGGKNSPIAWKNNLTKLVWKLRPLGAGEDTLTIDRPGACPVDASNKWSFDSGLLKLGAKLCLTVVMPPTIWATKGQGNAPSWPAVTLQACGGGNATGGGKEEQHWTRDASSRFHVAGTPPGQSLIPLIATFQVPSLSWQSTVSFRFVSFQTKHTLRQSAVACLQVAARCV